MTRKEFEAKREQEIADHRATMGKPSPKKFLYFAYGSNLNLAAMRYRCPHARPVAKIVLHGYRLVFKGVADVVKCKGGKVQGALYEVTDHCLAALDRFEGYRPDDPKRGMYRREYVRIKGHGEFKHAMFYKMNRTDRSMPIKPYYDTIRQGYEDWKLPKTSLIRARIETWRERKEWLEAAQAEKDRNMVSSKNEDGYSVSTPKWRLDGSARRRDLLTEETA